VDQSASRQLSALSRVGRQLDEARLDHWLFGGWAVDFYVGSVTRPHDDVDLAVWVGDAPRIAELLVADGWQHAPEEDEDGGTCYERERVRLELTYLDRDDDGNVFIPLQDRRASWAADALGDDLRALNGVSTRLIALSALARGKSSPRDDPEDAAKDRVDHAQLSSLGL
jgi:Aminoglycoside-2''-adenylyltransferase